MNIAIIVFYVVIIGAMMYFMAIKPQKKEQKRQQELMDSMEIGDYVGIIELVTVFVSHTVKHFHSLSDDFWSYPITWN